MRGYCTECGVRVNDYSECECTGYAESEYAEYQATRSDYAVSGVGDYTPASGYVNWTD